MLGQVPAFASLFTAGLLAGEEFIVRFGIRAPLRRLSQPAHISMRRELIRTLRVVVPIMFATACTAQIVAAVLVDLTSPRLCYIASVACLALFMAVTLFGTVPINKSAIGWDPEHPPADWLHTVARWESLDSVRTALAIGAFVAAILAALTY